MTYTDDDFETFMAKLNTFADPLERRAFMASMPDDMDEPYDDWLNRREEARIAVADLMARVMDSEEA